MITAVHQERAEAGRAGRMGARAMVVRPTAKINLMLRVGAARPDGFHDVRTLLQSIALGDRLTLTPRRGPFALMVRAPGLASDRTNLIWRAAEALWRAMGRDGEPRDVHVRLDKQIPMAAGLGGGSADAAAALVGLNAIWHARRSRADLIRVARELGSDVPFFLLGGTALGVGRGDELYPVDDVRRMEVVVIKPSFGVATADAYRWLDEDRAHSGARPAAPSSLDVGWPGGPLTLANDLQAPVAARHPMIDEIRSACLREGAVAVSMSGSGSAVFGVFPDGVARKAIRRLQRPDWLVLLTRTIGRREAGRRLGL
ncbi:MAG TPA: 4-(cytidine 5'-diphospho)-2-C-methyl-D-erythritol kinase [Vicinamibacterales bacterium]|nr:4-(cytidine 5'-diphospho)-2-C-methyl-D-erythritol kinase [Vicinamibacterales bacterium]